MPIRYLMGIKKILFKYPISIFKLKTNLENSTSSIWDDEFVEA